jgi:hypothetical protein
MIDTPLASLSDYKNRYTYAGTDTKLELFLADASAFLRQEFNNYDRDVDYELEHEKQYKNNVIAVVCALVNRSLIASETVDNANLPHAEQISTQAGSVSYSFNPYNPSGEMFLTSQEKDRLGLTKANFFTQNLTPHKRKIKEK